MYRDAGSKVFCLRSQIALLMSLRLCRYKGLPRSLSSSSSQPPSYIASDWDEDQSILEFMSVPNSLELFSVGQISSVVDGIWGSRGDSRNEQEKIQLLSTFYKYYENQREFEHVSTDDLSAAVQALKSFPEKRKSELQDSESELSVKRLQAPILDLAVRCMFLTTCSSPSTMMVRGTSIFRPRWKDSECLEEYLRRVFPMSRPPQQDLATFRLGKLRASYLQTYSNIQLHWTDHLSDHLILLKAEGWKRLYIFQHPEFLKVSLDTFGVDDEYTAYTNAGALRL